MTPTLVETQPKSPLETLARQFPQLWGSTMVVRAEVSSVDDGSLVLRTFRTADATYWETTSRPEGTTIKRLSPTDAKERGYEEAWRKVIASRQLPSERSGPIHVASDAYDNVLMAMWDEATA